MPIVDGRRRILSNVSNQFVEVLNAVPSVSWPSARATDSSSFVEIDSAFTDVGFSLSSGGRYLVQVSWAFYSGSTASGALKVIFDSGETNEKTWEDDEMTLTLLPDYHIRAYKMVEFEEYLSAGTHTLGLQWKSLSGTIGCAEYDGFQVTLLGLG